MDNEQWIPPSAEDNGQWIIDSTFGGATGGGQ